MLNLIETNAQLAESSPQARLEWAFERFGEDQLVFSSAFGTYSAALCHLVADVAPGTTVYFLDTGFHFPETLAFRDSVIHQLNLKLHVLSSSTPADALVTELATDRPFEVNPDRCCAVNKVEPMQALLKDKDAWISGLRQSQTEHRAGLDYLVQTEKGHYKFHPILDWSTKILYDYIQDNHLPLHPLWEKGYTSIGCAPCTAPCTPADGDERTGRWAGKSKTECGLHL